MRIHRKRILYPELANTFHPSTDVPLSYFSVNNTFVRTTLSNNFKLFCGGKMMLLLTHSGFLYIYNTPVHNEQEYIEAFLHEYAPQVTYKDIEHKFGKLCPIHIGSETTITI